jgi:hypothetical protein
LPQRDRETIAELAGGDLILHSLFATRRSGMRAPYGDADYVPYFITEEHPASGAELAALIEHHKREPFLLRHSQSGLTLPMSCGRYSQEILSHMDGDRSWHQIFDRVRAGIVANPPSDAVLFDHFQPWFDVLTLIDRLSAP